MAARTSALVAGEDGRGWGPSRRRRSRPPSPRRAAPPGGPGHSQTASRTNRPTRISTAQSRNGMRQPQLEERLLGLEGGQQGQGHRPLRFPRGRRPGPGRPEAAVLRLAVLGDEQDGPAPLAAEREALDQAEDHQQDRGEHADGRLGGQQAAQTREAIRVSRAAPDRTEGIRHDDRAGDRRRRRRLAHDVLSLLPDQGSRGGPGRLRPDARRADRRPAPPASR